MNAPTDGGLTIGKNSGSGWQNIGTSKVAVATPVPADGYASGTLTSGIFLRRSAPSPWPAPVPDAKLNPLPVTLVSFTARRQGTDGR
ncbi:MAG: hypothetical protein WKG07_35330 [Hymenobacter sp.]